jgi:hypothetical protein
VKKNRIAKLSRKSISMCEGKRYFLLNQEINFFDIFLQTHLTPHLVCMIALFGHINVKNPKMGDCP